MIDKKLILENAIRFGFINEIKKSNKNQKIINYAVKLGFAIDQGDEAIFPWNKTGDPTYETWLLNQLKDPQHMQKGLVNFREDGKTLEGFISEFDRLKKQRQITGVDINQLDFSGVKKIVTDNEQKVSRKAMERGEVDTSAKSGYELKIFKSVDDAEEVARIGQKTKWCTDVLNTAKSYLSKGAIYIVFKNKKPYAQLHVETQQYMDKNDSRINPEMWQELRKNIPFINQLVKRMKIAEAASAEETIALFDEMYKTGTVNGNFNWEFYNERGVQLGDIFDFVSERLKVVKGYLQLYRMPGENITLKDGLKVTNDLLLRGTSISQLPENLEVGGMLDITDTNIEDIPKSAKISGSIIPMPEDYFNEWVEEIERTGISRISIIFEHFFDEQDEALTSLFERGIIKKINGGLDITDSFITNFNNSLEINGYFDASNGLLRDFSNVIVNGSAYLTSIEDLELVSNVHIKGDLHIDNDKLNTFGRNVKIDGNLHLTESDSNEMSDEEIRSKCEIGGQIIRE